MTTDMQNVIHALNSEFLKRHPDEALNQVNQLSNSEILELLNRMSITEQTAVWDRLSQQHAVELLPSLDDKVVKQYLQRGDPIHAARILVRLDSAQRDNYKKLLDEAKQQELEQLVQYPDDSAGALMDVHYIPLYSNLTVRETLHRIRKLRPRFTRQLYLLDDQGNPESLIEIHRLALADSPDKLATFAQPIKAAVLATASHSEVVEQFEKYKITDLPVVDVNGRLIGIIRYDALLETVREESTADLLTMVGASKDERALSRIGFVVKKRLPWLQINLLTAFLAASVVGLFESTIATYTALAVLLPVVAGQSGNTGAQALAVTMRGLALREIGTSHWLKVARKELVAGFINGVAIAVTTAIGVWVWSSSTGLAMVIGVSMVFAMALAAVSGVIIPIVLAKLGQDPASSSSIILTTVTDVVGFFSFLGIATIFSGIL